VRRRMVEKRLRKLNGLRGEVLPPQFYGHREPGLLLVCWGSSQGAVAEAAASMSRSGREAGVLHFPQTWPLVPAQFMKDLQAADEVLCVEGNATAQFARLLRRETGFEVNGTVLRYDGLPFTPEFIVKGVEAWRKTR
jgi:2-oxoglutarate/2-oxoacid ferredoxin oxidoreductase subunit alpha